MGFVFTCLGIATALLIDDFIKIKLSNTFIMYASIFLLIINLLLYLLKNIPKTILNKIINVIYTLKEIFKIKG